MGSLQGTQPQFPTRNERASRCAILDSTFQILQVCGDSDVMLRTSQWVMDSNAVDNQVVVIDMHEMARMRRTMTASYHGTDRHDGCGTTRMFDRDVCATRRKILRVQRK